MDLKKFARFFAVCWGTATSAPFALISGVAAVAFFASLNYASFVLGSMFALLFATSSLNVLNWWHFAHGRPVFHPLPVSLGLTMANGLFFLMFGLFGLLDLLPLLLSIPNLVFTILAWKKII
ncbi:MAG TPA: hypothetical protein VI875_05050 [Candidatus Norongarragalinales archaeon]|nr:hypothetical protein [Candidatus Norongarragalinales archaeon]